MIRSLKLADFNKVEVDRTRIAITLGSNEAKQANQAVADQPNTNCPLVLAANACAFNDD